MHPWLNPNHFWHSRSLETMSKVRKKSAEFRRWFLPTEFNLHAPRNTNACRQTVFYTYLASRQPSRGATKLQVPLWWSLNGEKWSEKILIHQTFHGKSAIKFAFRATHGIVGEEENVSFDENLQVLEFVKFENPQFLGNIVLKVAWAMADVLRIWWFVV